MLLFYNVLPAVLFCEVLTIATTAGLLSCAPILYDQTERNRQPERIIKKKMKQCLDETDNDNKHRNNIGNYGGKEDIHRH